MIDGEAIVTDETGLAVFALLRSWRHDYAAVLCAFDLLELDGEEPPPAANRAVQANAGQADGRTAAGHGAQRALRGDGDVVYRHACKLSCEGIWNRAEAAAVWRDAPGRSSRPRGRFIWPVSHP